MRSNWAGETGAVWIYRGCEASLSLIESEAEREKLRVFVSEHMAAEEAHLAAIGAVVTDPSERSWMPAAFCGYYLGYLSVAVRGPRGMYVTTHAVESFVEEHYGYQISRLAAELEQGLHEPHEDYHELLRLLQSACADEVHHKEDAAKNARRVCNGGALSPLWDDLHFAFVYWGSRVGAAIAKRV